MKDIKIAVACHKPSILPRNSLFVPVQVGAAIAAKRLEGMRHDDEGENISEKNAAYCELTAQYWAWKNLQADYYGLCHYRRFLCFANVNDIKSVRNQFEAGAIDPYNLEKYGLENEGQMRSVIEDNDVVVGELQTVSRLYTPRGNQHTAYKHWTAHDRALIKTEDLDHMLEILNTVSPEVGKAVKEYLGGSKFLGFNCFVMKRELFHEMCAIEFAVLEELEKIVDLHTYNQQLARIYGFMGEIISSGYVYYLERQRKYKIKHVPLVYFNYTDALPEFTPAVENSAVSVFFDQSSELNFMFGAVLQSFLEHIHSEVSYDVLVLVRNLTPQIKQIYAGMVKPYSNVSLRFVPVELYEMMMKDQINDQVSILPFLPWLLPQYSKMLAFGPNILFRDAVDELWTADLEGALVAAPADILMRAKVNDIYVETGEKYLSKQMKDPLGYFSVAAMVLDLEQIREQYTQEDVYIASWNKEKKVRLSSEVLNVLLEGKTKILPQKWNTVYESNDYLKYQLPYAPKCDYLELLAARKNPSIISYMPDDVWLSHLNEADIAFWKVAEKLPIYQKYIAYMAYVCAPGKKEIIKPIDKIFPHHGKIRGFLIKIFPQGSARRKVAKRLLHFFHLQ